jgi:hypothetical protein
MLKKLNLDDDVFYIGLCDFRDIEKTIDANSPEYWYNYALKLDKASRILIRNSILKGYALNETDNCVFLCRSTTYSYSNSTIH